MAAKLRKMLGDINSDESIALMKLIETQSQATLSSWAVAYAKKCYLPVFKAQYPKNLQMDEAIAVCEEYLAGNVKLTQVKPVLKSIRQLAAEIPEPAAQAAARAISTACAAVQTPTNAFGYLLYGAAAAVYYAVGLDETREVYDRLAAAELQKALESLKQAAVAGETNPVKISWNC